jgi:hypothetical protein
MPQTPQGLAAFPEYLLLIYVSQEEICDRKILSGIQGKVLTKGLHFLANQLMIKTFQCRR